MYAANDERTTFAKQKDIMCQLGIRSPVVFDVGANIGQSIARYREIFRDSEIYSFEPNPEAMKRLRADTGAMPGIQLFNIALSDAIGESIFFVTAVHEASSLLSPDPCLMALSKDRKYDFRNIAVPTDTLDAFVRAHEIQNIDILKIDVQGAELMVLKGGETTLKSGKVKSIYLEVNLAPTYVGQTSLDLLLPFMAACRFQLWDIQPFVYTRVGRAWTANAIFVQEDVVDAIEA